MLLATAMVVMLTASLYASLSIAFKARSSALSTATSVRKGDLSMDLIRADLQAAVVPSGNLAGPFIGTSAGNTPGASGDGLVFFATAADIEPTTGVGDVKKIEYAFDATSGVPTLLRRVTTNLLALQTPVPVDEVVCRPVTAFTLRYFDGLSWTDSWDSTTVNNVLPKAVEVTLEVPLDRPDATGKATRKLTRMVALPCGVDSSDVTSSSTGSSSSSGGGR